MASAYVAHAQTCQETRYGANQEMALSHRMRDVSFTVTAYSDIVYVGFRRHDRLNVP